MIIWLLHLLNLHNDVLLIHNDIHYVVMLIGAQYLSDSQVLCVSEWHSASSPTITLTETSVCVLRRDRHPHFTVLLMRAGRLQPPPQTCTKHMTSRKTTGFTFPPRVQLLMSHAFKKLVHSCSWLTDLQQGFLWICFLFLVFSSTSSWKH